MSTDTRALAATALAEVALRGASLRDAMERHARKLDKAEARLDFNRTATELERQVRAFDPWPVAEGELAGENVRIWAALALDRAVDAAPGAVTAAGRDGIELACGQGVLRVTALQRPGGKRISAADYVNARPELRAR